MTEPVEPNEPAEPVEDVEDQVTTLLSEVYSGIPTSWVLIGTYIDEDGVLREFFLEAPWQILATTLGLIDIAHIYFGDRTREWVQRLESDEE